MHRVGAGLVLAVLSSACEPELVVGNWNCPPPDPELEARSKVVDVPWTTGFETGFCDYIQVGGFCYADPGAAYATVDAPVHGGRNAAAFTVTNADPGRQARCFREGTLPREARYGAWFFIPVLADNTGSWNLMHFRGDGNPPGLWDVSMRSADDGALHLFLFDHLRALVRAPDPAPEVPIGSWFHLEFRLRRAKDATGEVALYQDGALIYELLGIQTENTDFGQWYVGSFTFELPLPESTLYVDDVTIRAAP